MNVSDRGEPSDAALREPELLQRPSVPEPRRDQAIAAARAWLRWFGLGRLVVAALAVVTVVGGAVILLRPPDLPVEASLPRASTSVPAGGDSGSSGAAAREVESAPPSAAGARPVAGPGVGSGGAAGGGSAAASGGASGAGPGGASSGAPGEAAGQATAGGVAGVSLPVVVHVAGAVARPGVYTLRADERVADAVAAAGGATAEGFADALNLAAPLLDGMRILVPTVEEVAGATRLGSGGGADDGWVQVAPGAGGGASGSASGGGAGAAPGGPVDVNRASAEELDRLPGVGPATAAAIVSERERGGPFVSVDDLERVPGIGPAKVAALRELVST